MNKNETESIKDFLVESTNHLANFEIAKAYLASNGITLKQFPKDTSQYVLLTQHMRIFKGVFFRSFNPKALTTIIMQSLSEHLILRYNHHDGYAHASYKDFTEDFGADKKTIENNMLLLLKCGLWGRVRGKGNARTRYFPLFADKGMAEYQKLIAGAKVGIHPYIVEDKKGENKRGKPAELTPSVQIDGVDGVVDANGEIHDIPQEELSTPTEPANDDVPFDDIEPPLEYEPDEYHNIHEAVPVDEQAPTDYEPEPEHTSGFSSGGLG